MRLSYHILYPRLKLSELVNVVTDFMAVFFSYLILYPGLKLSESVNVVTDFKAASHLPHSVPQIEMSESAGRGYASVA